MKVNTETQYDIQLPASPLFSSKVLNLGWKSFILHICLTN